MEDGRLDSGVSKDVPQSLAVPVAPPDVPDQPFVHEALHGRPGVSHRYRLELHPLLLRAGVVYPLGRVADIEGDELEADGEVYEVEVEIVEAEVLETLPACGLHMLRVVVSVPQLRGHEQILPLTESASNAVSDATSDLWIENHIQNFTEHKNYC